MKKNPFGANFAVFVLFFGISVLEAFQKQEWFVVMFWLLAALLFLRADSMNREKK